MKLQNAEVARVEVEKLEGYLLSETHPIGRSKARYFRGVGFDESSIELLLRSLLAIAKYEDVIETVSSVHGVKYIVDGVVIAPSGIRVKLRTVWIIDLGHDRPRFVTAYPV